MSATYYYFECLNVKCGRDVVLNIRIKDGGKAFMTFHCPVCNKHMAFGGGKAAEVDGTSARVQPDTLRDAIKLVWTRIGGMHNPWTNAAMSSKDPYACKAVTDWYQTQIELGREMFAVVCQGQAPTEKLFRRGLDFLWGRS